jgi:Protein of unknown function (DUF3043)
VTSGATSAETAAQRAGKGRPTPTRAQAQAARKQRTAPPRNRKEAAARRKVAANASRGKMREAMKTGDERYLPARDQGPVRRYVRDYVDTHRTIGEFLLPIFFGIFLLVYVNSTWASTLGSTAWLVVIAALGIDSVRILRGVKAALRSKFGDDATSGITMYALMRAWQMRRLRLPKPQVKPGDAI